VTGPGAPPVRPTPAGLRRAAASGARVADVIAPGLDVLFCGINPGRWSGAVGHHFAHPGNRFWKAIYLAGFTAELLDPAREGRLLDMGLGVTNLVARTTATAAEVSPDELRRGAASLRRKVARHQPRAVAFLGLGAYRTAFHAPHAPLGEQPEAIGDTVVWLLPNPSGLQAHYPLAVLVAQLRALACRIGNEV
jgi:double-stranded uracil-DNA glycosylase